MPAAPRPPNERARLSDLRSLDFLDTEPEQAYEDIVGLASQVTHCPMATISMVDWDREWFKAKVGTNLTETSRATAFSAYVIASGEDVMEVHDAYSDERFHENALVAQESVRFFAGAAIHSPTGRVVGTLNVYDVVPRELTASEWVSLTALARQVEAQLALRKQQQELQRSDQVLALYQRRLERKDERFADALAAAKAEAMTDELTGLTNRRGMSARLQEELQRLERYNQPLTVAMIDIDRFKAYNDTHGHQAGDQALREVSRVLSEQARASDVVARYGGEEFLIIFSGTSTDGALAVADRIRAAMRSASVTGKPPTVSVGLAQARPGVSSEDLIAEADAALYRAKANGRDRVEIAVATDVGPLIDLTTPTTSS